MRKVVIFTMLCLLLLIMVPMTVGVSIHRKSEGISAFPDWTFLQGIVTRHRHVHINGGEYVEFNAIFLHYRTHWFGNIRSGFFHHFEKIVLTAFHYGYLGSHFVLAKFSMGLIP
ncbi:MAG TPA: hypothetical protein VN377_01555 [Candidatus Thermoplasmatota archaeon]|nr:hypothetical protein [Candidatus Thermoplasmatota archaeon]